MRVAWVRLDDNFANHPKIAPLPDGAFRIWVTMIAYCNRYRTNGRFTSAQLRHEVGMIRARRRHLESLISAGLVNEVDGLYELHDYHDYQPHLVTPEELSRKRREAGRKGAMARWQTDSNLPMAKNAPVPSHPVPSRPDPKRDDDDLDFLASISDLERTFTGWGWSLEGRWRGQATRILKAGRLGSWEVKAAQSSTVTRGDGVKNKPSYFLTCVETDRGHSADQASGASPPGGPKPETEAEKTKREKLELDELRKKQREYEQTIEDEMNAAAKNFAQ